MNRGLWLLATFAVLIIWIGLSAVARYAFGPIAGLPIDALWLLYGFVLFAFFHYRYLRQMELVHLLTTAAECRAPLAPMLWRYCHDRPRSSVREVCVAILLSVLPGYYWFHYRKNSYDRKLRALATLLESGETLYIALQHIPGVASRETVMAAAVGESSGDLARCLRGVTHSQAATFWLELAPRLVYPLFVLTSILGINAILMIVIIPKYQKIFADFGLRLPEITETLINVSKWFLKYSYLPGLMLLTLFLVGIAMFLSGSFSWHVPVLGYFYRRHVQCRFIKMLGILLESGRPVPEALAMLESTGYFRGIVRTRIEQARELIREGMPLSESLHHVGLMPGYMMPLVNAAERARNLPWALTQLGEQMGARNEFRLRRACMIALPLLIALLGFLAGCMVLGMFLPLIDLINHLIP